ncbi:S49 family peptidase [Desulfotalea psychrophila]|uniref:Related to capsid protein GPC of phage lambda n=1 Tax=Desulfotalea psychrophila (strain LSv54 / DSM 12343) TaxID=177439 RepID=Q6AMW2_DESPS|nr:S49 family peptidase [Desulfotalea psychrophila]CAG36312.1 related to capsid protein GPC of phage lambda [Desulfotalea psychrophila LSv54]
MITPHIVSEVLNRPLLVTPDKLHAILGVLNSKNEGHLDLDLAALAPLLGADKNGMATRAESRPVRRSSDEEKRVAIIPVIGSLVARNRGFDDGSGLRSYRTIAHEIDQALADQSILGIVLDIDSYGGAAAGCARLAGHIKEAGLVKPIYANIDLNCFSAATWIASACTKVFLSDGLDAGMGSVGCIAIHRDQSVKNEKEGEVYTAVYFGERKNDFSPHQPLSGDLQTKMQAGVDRMGHAFAAAVAENRGLDLQAVLKMQAGTFYGQDAITHGLADGVASLTETVALLGAEAEERERASVHNTTGLTQAKNRGETMSLSEKLSALLAEEGAVQALAKLGYIAADAAKTEMSEALTAQKSSCLDAVNLAAIAGANALQVKAILEGENLSSEHVGATLQSMRASAGAKNLASTISHAAGDGKHPLVAAAEKVQKSA